MPGSNTGSTQALCTSAVGHGRADVQVGVHQGDADRQPDIPLQVISVAHATAIATTTPSTSTQHHSVNQSHGSGNLQRQPYQPATANTPVTQNDFSVWLWSKGCTLWGWFMTIIMLAIAVATYVITRTQVSMDDGRTIQRQIGQQLEYKNKADYFKYCKNEEEAGRLLSECESSLEEGLSPPPRFTSDDSTASSSNTYGTRSTSSSSQSHAKVKRANGGAESGTHEASNRLNRAEYHVAKTDGFAVSLLHSILFALGVRRGLSLMLGGGQRLGTGRQSYGWPTFESSVPALAIR